MKAKKTVARKKARKSPTAVKQRDSSEKKVLGRPFVKGDPRINRNGRKPREKVLTELAFDYLEKAAHIKVGDIQPGTKKWKELIALGWLIHIVKGSGKHLEMFLDRIEGKVEQPVKVAGDSEAPISFTIKIDDNRNRNL